MSVRRYDEDDKGITFVELAIVLVIVSIVIVIAAVSPGFVGKKEQGRSCGSFWEIFKLEKFRHDSGSGWSTARLIGFGVRFESEH